MPELSEHGFGEFYRRHARALWAYVYSVTGNAADAADIVQDEVCRMLTAEVSELNEEDRRKYVFRVAGNLIVDRWRRSNSGLSCAGGARAAPDASFRGWLACARLTRNCRSSTTTR